MSRVLWIDASFGVAGDMLLAALVDAGAPLDAIRAATRALGLPEVSFHSSEVQRGAFRARRMEVKAGGVPTDAGGFKFTPVARTKTPLTRAPDHEHRPWREIRRRIEGADLPARVRTRALRAYERLATAEAKLHGMAVDDVELHEVGAADAIADIVGVCVALEELGVDRVVATPLPLGSGRVKAAHGEIPLPAPATLEVLLGWPVVTSPWPGEWVTPTGAALVAALAEPGGCPPMTPCSIGHGAGGRNPTEFANLVRVVVGEVASTPVPTESLIETACNLDDATGQLVGALIPRLLASGAVDAWAVPATMKKGRPGIVVHALSSVAQARPLADLLLRETPSLGVRQHRVERTVLDRWWDEVETSFGSIRVKVGGRDGVPWHATPEYDDVAERAAASNAPFLDVQQAAMAAWRACGESGGRR